ncbi:hypothetical protein COO91_05313 [Nostoc flagelliforme CCNUN1]|uniref:Uncharacterized protein n=1 Tax=Nostoc flagelliforme CCNUN1 TaxID=2038116 RepID=A0A2K8SV23_9NOSO|nr:hypothetical protein COO91_05313 [Nostoc flagelliforme CCNUN1]
MEGRGSRGSRGGRGRKNWIAVPTQMRYNVISQDLGARHGVPLRVTFCFA